MGCAFSCSSDEDKCNLPFGSCSANKPVCNSSCVKETQKEGANIEDIIDAVLKKAVHEHITPVIEKQIGHQLAIMIESGVFRAIDIDLIQHHNGSSKPTSVHPSPATTIRRLRVPALVAAIEEKVDENIASIEQDNIVQLIV